MGFKDGPWPIIIQALNLPLCSAVRKNDWEMRLEMEKGRRQQLTAQYHMMTAPDNALSLLLP